MRTIEQFSTKTRKVAAVASVAATIYVAFTAVTAASSTVPDAEHFRGPTANSVTAPRAEATDQSEGTEVRTPRARFTEDDITGIMSIRTPRVRYGETADGRDETPNVEIRMLHRPGEVVASGRGTGNWSSMYEFLEFAIVDADRYWTSVLTSAGYPEPWVNFRLPAPGQVYRTACGPTDDRSMFYCPSDDTIVFSQQLAADLWSGTFVGPDGQRVAGMVGDFAAATMVAHEFAHSVQSELGVLGWGLPVHKLEKHADCWAGAWAGSAEQRGLLDPGDIEEGLTVAFLVGDSHFDSSDHHGTSAQRQAAFYTGYQHGPGECGIFLQ